jgi:peptidoglycan/LPS O-acetylase OafA/YrhL
MGVLAHTWSLAIEEQYYLLWPATIIIASRLVRSRRALALLVVSGAVVVAALRLFVFASGSHVAAALWTPTRADGVLLGSALALVLAEPPAWLARLLRRRAVPLLTGGALFVASLVIYWDLPALYRGGLLALNLCAAALIGHLVLRPESVATRILATQPLPAIGRISYGLYLYHIPVNYLVVGHPARWTGLPAAATAIALTFLVAGLSFWFVERPVLGLKRRFGSMSQMPRVVAPT